MSKVIEFYVKAAQEEEEKRDKKPTPPPSPKPKNKVARDQALLSSALAKAEGYKDVGQVGGTEFLEVGGLRGYKLSFIRNKQQEHLMAFCYDVPVQNEAFEFLLKAAYHRNLSGMVQIMPGVVIFKDYKE